MKPDHVTLSIGEARAVRAVLGSMIKDAIAGHERAAEILAPHMTYLVNALHVLDEAVDDASGFVERPSA